MPTSSLLVRQSSSVILPQYTRVLDSKYNHFSSTSSFQVLGAAHLSGQEGNIKCMGSVEGSEYVGEQVSAAAESVGPSIRVCSTEHISAQSAYSCHHMHFVTQYWVSL